ncbi:MAG: cyclic pyranopterin phosphate synthase MoaA, partial [Bacteroidetes bacterium]|nr:cyclic pyranopterin phosphate synthase MoaA [Bacteroidota bacterium]
ISTKYAFLKLEDAINDTAKKYTVSGHAGTFAFITTITEPFCGSCNRLRLTADGKMKNCLFSQDETDLLKAMRKGEDIAPLILSCLQNKKRERGGRFDFDDASNLSTSVSMNTGSLEDRSMIRIGG